MGLEEQRYYLTSNSSDTYTNWNHSNGNRRNNKRVFCHRAKYKERIN